MQAVIAELQSLFNDARQKNEFEFIQTLIDYKGIGGSATLYEWFEAIDFYKSLYKSLSGKEKIRMGLLIYSNFFENAEFYNIIGNFCLIQLGYRAAAFLYWKNRKKDRLLGTGEKIRLISERLGDCGRNNILNFFFENHHEQIRNTFFHSCYSFDDGNYQLHNTDSVIVQGIGSWSLEIDKFLLPCIENAIIFYDTFKNLFFDHFNSYTQDKVIIGLFPYPRPITILGSQQGLKGFWIENIVQFFGEWHGGGVLYDDRFKTWSAMNIRIVSPNQDDTEVEERIQRYEMKPDINLSDSEFFNLLDKLNERQRPAELARAFQLLIKFGDVKYEKWSKEANMFKKVATSRRILPYYKKAIGFNKNSDMTQVTSRIVELEKIAALDIA